MRDQLIVFGVFLLVVAFVFLVIYAHVSACGWKGLFVECRIVECSK